MRRLALVTGALVAVALPSTASASTIHGTVVHRNAHAHAFVVATRGGTLKAVRSSHRPAVGRVVAVRSRRLKDGTLTVRSMRLHGTRRHVVLRGTVSSVDARHQAFVLSARGVSLVVDCPKDATGDTPAAGQTAVVDATVGKDDALEADDVQETGQASTYELEGIVKSVDQAAETLTVSSDDEDQLGSDLVVHFPAGTDLSGFTPGSEAELRVTRAADGTLTAVSGSGDDNQGDDNQGEGDGRQGSGDDHGQDGQPAPAPAPSQPQPGPTGGDGGGED